MKVAPIFAIAAMCSFGAMSDSEYTPPPSIIGVHYMYNFAYNVYCQYRANSGLDANQFCAMHQAYQIATRFADATGADKDSALAELMSLAKKDPKASVTFGNAFYFLLLIQQHYEHLKTYRLFGWRTISVGPFRREYPGLCMNGECTPEYIEEFAQKVRGTVTGDYLIARCKASYANAASEDERLAKQKDLWSSSEL